jgi:hypothetical protein
MWEHYKKTFKGIQLVIALVAVGVYFFFGRHWQQAAVFFLVMQFSAVMGAVWAARLRAVMQRRSQGLLKAHARI